MGRWDVICRLLIIPHIWDMEHDVSMLKMVIILLKMMVVCVIMIVPCEAFSADYARNFDVDD